jgi:hypothetical protein
LACTTFCNWILFIRFRHGALPKITFVFFTSERSQLFCLDCDKAAFLSLGYLAISFKLVKLSIPFYGGLLVSNRDELC